VARKRSKAAEPSLPLDSPVEARVGLRGLQVDDDLILIDLLSDRSFRLNSTAGRIWMLIQERRTVREVAEALQQEYSLDRSEAEEAVTEHIKYLVELGIAATEGESIHRE